MHSEGSYAAPIKALHLAHVYHSVAFQTTRAPLCGPQHGCCSTRRISRQTQTQTLQPAPPRTHAAYPTTAEHFETGLELG